MRRRRKGATANEARLIEAQAHDVNDDFDVDWML